MHLDFLDVDVDNETLIQARKHMVLGQRGSVSFTGPILLDMKHVFDGDKYKKYTFLPILDSAFRLEFLFFYCHIHIPLIFPKSPHPEPPEILTSNLSAEIFTARIPSLF